MILLTARWAPHTGYNLPTQAGIVELFSNESRSFRCEMTIVPHEWQTALSEYSAGGGAKRAVYGGISGIMCRSELRKTRVEGRAPAGLVTLNEAGITPF